MPGHDYVICMKIKEDWFFMEVMTGAKRTDAGVIPEDWKLRLLPGAATIAKGPVNPFRSMIIVAPNHIDSGPGRLI